jgi:predicted TIM-barrel fold metal-dependent hydrolase
VNIEPAFVSADSHVNVPVAAWAQYLPDGFKDRAPTIERTPDGDFVVFEGARVQQLQLSDLAGVDPKDFKLAGSDGRAGSWDPAARIQDQQVDGVIAEILYGGSNPLTRSADPAVRVAGVRAYNDWLSDFCSMAPDRLIGLAELPLATVDDALAELRRAYQRGHRGVVITAFPPTGTWGDELWEPLWHEAADTGMPIHFHLGARRYMPTPDPSFMVNVSMSKFACAEPIATFIFFGILQRHPALRLVSVEGGVGWMAFMVAYIDHAFQKHRYWTNSPLTEIPSHYFHTQVLGTFVDDPVGLRERETIGVENIMWSSDYPHSETTWPDSQKLLSSQMEGISDHDRTRIVRDNARDLYNLSLPA